LHLRPSPHLLKSSLRLPPEASSPEIIKGYTRFKELFLKVFHLRNACEEELVQRNRYGFREYLQINEWVEEKIREL